MRTYKFRGRRKLNGGWVYGSLIINGDTVPVWQFIGLLDKNSKENYGWYVDKSKSYTINIKVED